MKPIQDHSTHIGGGIARHLSIQALVAVMVFFLATGFAHMASAQSEGETAEVQELLTEAELQNLVAPIALYPDTLLVQIAVASTEPFEIMKAQRYLLDNAGREPEEMEAEIDAMGWDPSVSVLALVFPGVLMEMATHVDWTETLGTAMLAQPDDVMAAVQVMRTAAINSGALVSGPQQTVEEVDDAVVITPTNPEVVYVPQYDTQTVYTGPSAGDIVGTALLTFGTVAIIDSIFDDDDDWNDYWGCRNCGGWGNGPIIRNPDIDIDVDGNVNIGNNIGNGNRPDIGWSPEPDRAEAAKDRLSERRNPEAQPGRLPVERKGGRQNELREKLSAQTGTTDISRNAGAALAAGAGIAGGSAVASRLPQAGSNNAAARKAEALRSTHQRPAVKKPAVAAKPKAAKRPAASKPAAAPQRPKASGSALKKRSSGQRTRAASSRAGGARVKRGR
ncbi:MAG: DUF3300 domain-containing protein [Arenibacterium sp.]